ncbi:hypothetical protein MKX07_004541 [Trichoderma sp. CBMAI-0711]|nr:hypothetical protein MKX07_004541 [Trichoderma sp. CBMAI-0711]
MHHPERRLGRPEKVDAHDALGDDSARGRPSVQRDSSPDDALVANLEQKRLAEGKLNECLRIAK